MRTRAKRANRIHLYYDPTTKRGFDDLRRWLKIRRAKHVYTRAISTLADLVLTKDVRIWIESPEGVRRPFRIPLPNAIDFTPRDARTFITLTTPKGVIALPAALSTRFRELQVVLGLRRKSHVVDRALYALQELGQAVIAGHSVIMYRNGLPVRRLSQELIFDGEEEESSVRDGTHSAVSD